MIFTRPSMSNLGQGHRNESRFMGMKETTQIYAYIPTVRKLKYFYLRYVVKSTFHQYSEHLQ